MTTELEKLGENLCVYIYRKRERKREIERKEEEGRNQ